MTEVESQVVSPSSNLQLAKSEEEEDDFEKQLASFIENEEKRDQQEKEKNSPSNNNSNVEKGETDTLERERNVINSNEDDYTVTSDQQRAMDELLAQREEEDFLGEEDPPEYNVKERLLQLNAELANDPTPLDNDQRDVRIKFKDNLVDLVAPPPSFSDDEPEESEFVLPLSKLKDNQSSSESSNTNNSGTEKNKGKKFVVEREGKFEVLHAEEMTSTERAIFISDSEDQTPPPTSYLNTVKFGNTNNSNVYKPTKQPSPPTKPRPATANASNTRRTVRPSSSKPRPRSAAVPLSNTSPLEHFNYHSPYAISEDDRNHFKQQSKQLQERKRQDEAEKKRIEKEKAENAASIYNAWLEKKTEEDNRRRKEEQQKRKQECKTEDKTQLNEDTFHSWMKNKQCQLKSEKLLKKRQDQEMKDGVVVHNKEDCDKTFKKWLRKKNAEIRRKRNAERQKLRYIRLTSRKSRKSQALARAINQSQSYKYVDYNY